MEIIHTESERVKKLLAYISLLKTEKTDRNLWDLYADVLESVTAQEVNETLHLALVNAEDIDSWKQPVSKFLRACAHSIEKTELPIYERDSVLFAAEKENTAVSLWLASCKTASVALSEGTLQFSDFMAYFCKENPLYMHYVSLQNDLFARFEVASPFYACVKMMWALEDDVLDLYKKISDGRFAEANPEFWKLFGAFFLLANSLWWRERFILFPSFYQYSKSSIEAVDSSFGLDSSTNEVRSFLSQNFKTLTGSLDHEVLEVIFKLLPLDIAFIGADNRLKFYSDPPHRVFPRAPALVGRLVQNCHPPKSVDRVMEIIDSFRDGSRDSAEFWLEFKGKFIHIEYFAVRFADGSYAGTLEVSQDASHVRSLVGEKRLL